MKQHPHAIVKNVTHDHKNSKECSNKNAIYVARTHENLITEVVKPQVLIYVCVNKFYYVITFTTIKQFRFCEAVRAAAEILKAKFSPNILYSPVFQD
jgi:hypothetical protein